MAVNEPKAMRLELFPMYEGTLIFIHPNEGILASSIEFGAEGIVLGSGGATESMSARRWIGTLTQEMQNKTISLVNALEIWAMPFVHGLADREKAI